MVATELVRISDSDRIQTMVIHVVSGHYSLYMDTIIKFPDIPAYKRTSLRIIQHTCQWVF